MVTTNKGAPGQNDDPTLQNVQTRMEDVEDTETGDGDGANGYQLLGMTDDEVDRPDSDDEIDALDFEEEYDQENGENDGNLPDIEPAENVLIKDVWSGNRSNDIPMDEQKVDVIMDIMKQVSLPDEAPCWVMNDDIIGNLVKIAKKDG